MKRMWKRRMAGLLSVLLCLTMVFGQPATANAEENGGNTGQGERTYSVDFGAGSWTIGDVIVTADRSNTISNLKETDSITLTNFDASTMQVIVTAADDFNTTLEVNDGKTSLVNKNCENLPNGTLTFSVVSLSDSGNQSGGNGDNGGVRTYSVDFGAGSWTIGDVTVTANKRSTISDIKETDSITLTNFDASTMQVIVTAKDGFNTTLEVNDGKTSLADKNCGALPDGTLTFSVVSLSDSGNPPQGEADFTAVIWDGDQVENKSAHGSISVSSVVIGSTTYTYKGNGKFENNNTETDLIEWYGYDKTDIEEEAGVRIFDDAFENEDTEVYINFMFKPDYGYQVTGIGINEDSTSLASAGFNAAETISTFQFKVYQHNNPHFTVVFSESADVTDVSGAQNVTAATIANGQNITDSGNLKLTVNDLSDSDKETAQSQFAEYLPSNDSSEVMYFDLELFQVVSKGTEGSNWENQLTELNDDLSVTLELSDELKDTDGTLSVIRAHEETDGTVTYTKLDVAYDQEAGTITFDTDKFSVYALVIEKEGIVDNTTDTSKNACGADLNENTDDLLDKVLTDEEKERVKNGEDVKVYLEVYDISSNISTADKDLIDAKKGEATVGMYFEINLMKQIGLDAATNVTETDGAVTITLEIPDSLINTDANITRTYQMVRIHDGVATVLPCQYKDGKISFQTDMFSTYALIYTDKVMENTTTPNVPQSPETVVENTTTLNVPQSPETGDVSSVGIYFMMLSLGLGIVLWRNKKKYCNYEGTE